MLLSGHNYLMISHRSINIWPWLSLWLWPWKLF